MHPTRETRGSESIALVLKDERKKNMWGQYTEFVFFCTQTPRTLRPGSVVRNFWAQIRIGCQGLAANAALGCWRGKTTSDGKDVDLHTGHRGEGEKESCEEKTQNRPMVEDGRD